MFEYIFSSKIPLRALDLIGWWCLPLNNSQVFILVEKQNDPFAKTKADKRKTKSFFLNNRLWLARGKKCGSNCSVYTSVFRNKKSAFVWAKPENRQAIFSCEWAKLVYIVFVSGYTAPLRHPKFIEFLWIQRDDCNGWMCTKPVLWIICFEIWHHFHTVLRVQFTPTAPNKPRWIHTI